MSSSLFEQPQMFDDMYDNLKKHLKIHLNDNINKDEWEAWGQKFLHFMVHHYILFRV
jgi:hypothetical protein